MAAKVIVGDAFRCAPLSAAGLSLATCSRAFARTMASRRPLFQVNQPSAAVVRFTNDHYFDLSGTQFLSVSSGRRAPSTSIPTEKSARVVLETAPRHFKEITAEAKKMGVSQYFVSSEPQNPSPSELHISFSATPKSLKSYVDERRNRFFQEYPAGLVQRIALLPGVTRHLNAECEAILFDPFAQVSINDTNRPAHMSLLVQTTDGCWELSWHGQLRELYNRHGEFVQMIKKLRKLEGNGSTDTPAAESAPPGVGESSPDSSDKGVFAS
eukprot:TRINITY_DN26854_c0_g1_i1.p1 TRINITY_DN26854_c0_g1~~TRINITY_DN26854_c0_g1_i1.p1  ORF type:complete len:269 (-),score=34.77 TRINITY_DN26854_c0_g1_i1:40-846(-)